MLFPSEIVKVTKKVRREFYKFKDDEVEDTFNEEGREVIEVRKLGANDVNEERSDKLIMLSVSSLTSQISTQLTRLASLVRTFVRSSQEFKDSPEKIVDETDDTGSIVGDDDYVLLGGAENYGRGDKKVDKKADEEGWLILGGYPVDTLYGFDCNEDGEEDVIGERGMSRGVIRKRNKNM